MSDNETPAAQGDVPREPVNVDLTSNNESPIHDTHATPQYTSEANTDSQNTQSTSDTAEDTPTPQDIYQPPHTARETRDLDAAVDGTSASHYGTNDPAQFEKLNQTESDDK